MVYLDYLNAVLVEGNDNTRHFGGYQTVNGKTVVKKKLIRSGVPGKFTENDIVYLLNEYNLKYVIDLRNSAEITSEPSLEYITGVQYINLPLLSENNLKGKSFKTGDKAAGKAGNIWIELFYKLGGTVESVMPYMLSAYLDVITDQTIIERGRQFFDILLENKNSCVFFHCSAGKDRTGAMAAIILSALGVSWKVVMEDYMLSNAYRREFIDQQMAEVMAETDDSEVIEGVGLLFYADMRFLDSFLKTIEENYGSMDNYLSKALLLTADKIDKLRAVYTE